MTEANAISIIKTEVAKTISSFDIDVISRNFEKCSEYIATIVVIFKDDSIQPQTFIDLRDKLMNDGITEIRFVNTQKDLKDMNFEVLTLEAEIFIGE